MKFIKPCITICGSCCGSLFLFTPKNVRHNGYSSYPLPNKGVRVSFVPFELKYDDMTYEEVKTSEGTIYLEFVTQKLMDDLISFGEGVGQRHPYYNHTSIYWKEYFPEFYAAQALYDPANPDSYDKWKSADRALYNITYPTKIEHFSIQELITENHVGKVGMVIDAGKNQSYPLNIIKNRYYTKEETFSSIKDRIIYTSPLFHNLGYTDNRDPYLTLYIFEK